MEYLDPGDYDEKFNRWIELVTGMHRNFHFTSNDRVAWTPLAKPLGEARLALVSTAGVHLKSQEPFDLMSHDGDWSLREIPKTAAQPDFAVSHSHYDTAAAKEDIDTVFPIHTARRLAEEGVVGGLTDVHFGLMGFVPGGEPMKREAAPELARRLRAQGADIVFLCPG